MMRSTLATKLALAAALSQQHGGLPTIKSSLPPREKTSYDLDRLAKAEEKRIRKAKKRLAQPSHL